MRVTTVFNKLLALQGAFVQRLEFTADGIVVGVRKRALLHGCPTCSFCCRARYDCRQREWRHVSLGKWRVTVQAMLCRLDCPEHGVVTETVPWAEHDSRLTRDFEDLVACDCALVPREFFGAFDSARVACARTGRRAQRFGVVVRR